MKNKKTIFILFSGLIVLSLGVAVFYLFFNKDAGLVTEASVREMVENQYGGSTITSLETKGDTYIVLIENDMGDYQVMVDGRTGEISSLKRLNKKEATPSESDGSKEPTSEEKTPDEKPAPSMLTKEQAIEIALAEVAGKVEDVELDEEDGVKVYEIEIEVDDDTEATIILNAYTGEILSLTWD